MWNKTYKYYESAPKESLSGEFYKSKRLMNCMEYFIKGNTKNHKQNKDNQIKQLKYFLKMFKREYESGGRKFKNFPYGLPEEQNSITGKLQLSEHVGFGQFTSCNSNLALLP